MTVNGQEFTAGGPFPPGWLSRHINVKEAFAVSVLREFCVRYPGGLLGAHKFWFMWTISLWWTVFARIGSKGTTTHRLLCDLF